MVSICYANDPKPWPNKRGNGYHAASNGATRLSITPARHRRSHSQLSDSQVRSIRGTAMSLFKHRLIIVLRWLAVAPAAIAAAALARLLLIVANRWTMDRYVNPDSLMGSTWIIFISTVAYTGVLVYVSAYVAPFGRKAVSIVVATLATTTAVALFIMSLMAEEYESTFYSICFAAGACVTSYSIVHGEIKMPAELVWNSDGYDEEDASCVTMDDNDELDDGPSGDYGFR